MVCVMKSRWVKWVLIAVPMVVCGQPEHAMSGLLHFHPQFHYLHPSTVPEGKLHLGLPVLSKVSLLANHRLSYRDVFLSERSFVDALSSRSNSLGLEVGLGTFMLGYRSSWQHYASFFINERAAFFLYYPKDLVSFLWQGNTAVAGRTIELNALHAEMLMYREVGMSYSFPVNRRLRLGFQLKYLVGLANVHIPRNSTVDLDVDPRTFEHRLRFEQWRVRWAGLPLDSALSLGTNFAMTDLILNDNRGYALGMGMSYRVTPFTDLHVSLRDLGFIRWKSNTFSYMLEDNMITVDGVEEEERVEDLGSELSEAFVLEGTDDPYTTFLHYNLLSTLSWRMTRDNYLSASLGLQRVPSRDLGYIRAYYSVSYMRQLWRRLSASVFVIRYPQRFTMGTALAYQVGVFQLHGAVGNILGLFDVPNIHVVDFNIGLNIVTGRRIVSRRRAVLCPSYL